MKGENTKQYKIGNVVVKIHGAKPQKNDTLEAACIRFMAAVGTGVAK